MNRPFDFSIFRFRQLLFLSVFLGLGLGLLAAPICPISLKINQLSDYNNFGVSCAGSHDGRAEVVVSGMPQLPLEIYWSNGEATLSPTQLASGWSKVTVTDAAGCRAEDSIFLTEPPEISPNLAVFGEKCFHSADGRIEIGAIAGGVPPFLSSLNGGPSAMKTQFSPLTAGPYFLKIEDANGCADTFGLVVTAGLPFDFELGFDTASMFLDDTFRLPLFLPSSIDTVLWSPADAFLGFSAQSEALFSPEKTTHLTATAISTDGCETLDDFVLRVKRRRNIYFPNALSHSAKDEENRFFTAFTSSGVAEIESLDIFDRWGELVFSKKNFPANQPELGWDGFQNGRASRPDVFVFRVILKQSNGIAKLYFGNLTVFD